MKIDQENKNNPMDNSGNTIDNAVTVHKVCKNYSEVEALKDLSLDFPRGQLTSLLGPSGCGKTTLLKIIAGLLPATSGKVMVNDQPVSGRERTVLLSFRILRCCLGRTCYAMSPLGWNCAVSPV